MLRCREISKLVSESMEHKLSLRVRMQVWMHLWMCRFCSGFARQLRLFRLAARQYPERLATDDATEAILSQEARQRIKSTLREESS